MTEHTNFVRHSVFILILKLSTVLYAPEPTKNLNSFHFACVNVYFENRGQVVLVCRPSCVKVQISGTFCKNSVSTQALPESIGTPSHLCEKVIMTPNFSVSVQIMLYVRIVRVSECVVARWAPSVTI